MSRRQKRSRRSQRSASATILRGKTSAGPTYPRPHNVTPWNRVEASLLDADAPQTQYYTAQTVCNAFLGQYDSPPQEFEMRIHGVKIWFPQEVGKQVNDTFVVYFKDGFLSNRAFSSVSLRQTNVTNTPHTRYRYSGLISSHIFSVTAGKVGQDFTMLGFHKPSSAGRAIEMQFSISWRLISDPNIQFYRSLPENAGTFSPPSEGFSPAGFSTTGSCDSIDSL